MDSTFAEFGATLAVGAFLLLGAGLIVELCRPKRVLRYARLRSIPQAILISFVAAVALTAGLLVENLSNLVVDNFSHLLSPIPNEKTLRASVLLNPRMWSQFHRNENALKLLRRAYVSHKTLALLTQNDAPKVEHDTDVNEIYYTAKNIVYTQENYYNELRTHQSRIDFSRSFTMCCLLLCGCTILALSSLYKPSPAIGKIGTLKRLSVAFVIFLALYWIGRYAYTAEEIEFNKRTFGYFLIVAMEKAAGS